MQHSPESLYVLIRELYSAAAESSRWEAFMESLTPTIGATACSIIVRNERPEQAGQHTVTLGLDPRSVQAYKDYYSSINIVYEAALKIAPNEYVGTLQRCVDENDYRNSEIYNDYARPQDLFHQCCAVLAHEGNYAAAISFMRPERNGEFGKEQVELLSLLAPHMRQAFQMHNRLRALEASALGLSAGLDQSETAVFLLDGAGCMQWANAAGFRLLSNGTGLCLQTGHLRPRLNADCADFDALVRLTCDTGNGRGTTPGGMCLLHRQNGRPLHCRMVPFSSENTFQEVRPAAILFIGDPDCESVSRTEELRVLYGLTGVESRLADRLLRGSELRDAAQELGITFETARFHLKRVFAKTGTSRQSDLLKLMLRIPAKVQR